MKKGDIGQLVEFSQSLFKRNFDNTMRKEQSLVDEFNKNQKERVLKLKKLKGDKHDNTNYDELPMRQEIIPPRLKDRVFLKQYMQQDGVHKPSTDNPKSLEHNIFL